MTIFTVLALLITIVAGLFGMNIGGIPLAQEDRGFWIVVGIVTAFTVVAMWLVFRKRGDRRTLQRPPATAVVEMKSVRAVVRPA